MCSSQACGQTPPVASSGDARPDAGSDEPSAHRAVSAHRLPVWARLANLPFIGGIWLYRITLSRLTGQYCRFTPTCSQYALDAYHTHGPFRGTALTIARLARCQPLCRGGYDPVPLPTNTPMDVSPRVD